MLKKLSYLLVLIAVTITLSHAFIAHHHHFHESSGHHHHHENESDHNIFSFVDIDEIFIPGHQTEQSDELLATLCFILPLNYLQTEEGSSEKIFALPQIYPPPDHPELSSLAQRGPPCS